MILTDEEKNKFIAYLEEEVATNKILIDKMQIINAPEILIKHKIIENKCFEFVINYLNTWEKG